MSNYSSTKTRHALILSAGLWLAGGCDDGTGETAALEIVGSYKDDFDGSHEITETTWTMDGVGVFQIETFDNDADFLVAQNDGANDYAPGLWSRMDWTFDGADLYFCQFAYEAATEQDAAAADGADRNDLVTGCGGFGWSQLIAN